METLTRAKLITGIKWLDLSLYWFNGPTASPVPLKSKGGTWILFSRYDTLKVILCSIRLNQALPRRGQYGGSCFTAQDAIF